MKYPHPTAQTQFSAIHPEAQRRVVASMVLATSMARVLLNSHHDADGYRCDVVKCNGFIARRWRRLLGAKRQILEYIVTEVAS